MDLDPFAWIIKELDPKSYSGPWRRLRMFATYVVAATGSGASISAVIYYWDFGIGLALGVLIGAITEIRSPTYLSLIFLPLSVGAIAFFVAWRLAREQGYAAGLAARPGELFAFVKELEDGGFHETANEMLKPYSRLMDTWGYAIVERAQVQASSGYERLDITFREATLITYLDELSKLRNQRGQSPFLPANFEMYAICVAKMLNIAEGIILRRKRSMVRIWTYLNRLQRWPNVTWSDKTTGGVAHSYKWWEDYKDTVKKIKGNSESVNGKFLQMLRLIGRHEGDDQLIVLNPAYNKYKSYLDDEHDKCLKLPGAYRLNNDFRLTDSPCPRIDEQVAAALNHLSTCNDLPIHLFGSCAHGEGKHRGWVNIQRDLGSYHTQVLGPGKRIRPDAPGVYCVYDVATRELDMGGYEDVFIIDMERLGFGKFGIGFRNDETKKLSGMVFLDSDESDSLVGNFTERWDAATA